MSRITGSKCRYCRREGQKLFLKGERCYSPKCAMLRKNYPPGAHGLSSNMRSSEYSRQLREKQKVKRMYGLNETQMTNYYDKANKKRGVTGDNLLNALELRLDNVLRSTGYILSPQLARQLVSHNHLLVNGKRVTVPSFQCKVGDVIEFKERSKKLKLDKPNADQGTPDWLNFDAKAMKIEVVDEPNKEALENLNINTQLIVEFYSR